MSLFRSLHLRLFLLVLTALIPPFLLFVGFGLRGARQVEESIRVQALEISRSVAEQQRLVAAGARQTLTLLAHLPDVREERAEPLHRLFASILRENPVYSTVAAVDARGLLYASAVPITPYSVADREYFLTARRERRFSAGRYIVGRSTGIPAIPFVLPLVDGSDAFRGVLVATERLEPFRDFLRNVTLPPASALSILDGEGTRLFRYPPDEGYPVGEPVSGVLWSRIRDIREPIVFEATLEDGQSRLFACVPLSLERGDRPYLYVLAGIPAEAILASVRSALFRNLGLAAGAAALALALALALGHLSFIRRFEALMDRARRFASGDWNLPERGVTTGEGNGDELSRLGEALDGMARSLSAREKEREALRRDMERLATRDALTGALNRGAGLRRLEEALEESDRIGRPLAVAFADLDGLKHTNDTFGHLAGDTLLAATAEAMRSDLGPSDALCRIGGDEFLLVLPDRDLPEAEEFWRRIRGRFEEVSLRYGLPRRVRASVGFAVHRPGSSRNPDDLIREADEAMYRDKAARRGFSRPPRPEEPGTKGGPRNGEPGGEGAPAGSEARYNRPGPRADIPPTPG